MFAGFEIRESLDEDANTEQNGTAADGDLTTSPRPPEEPKMRPPETVHFVLPLFNRLATFDRFVDNYETVCAAAGERVTLTVVPFGRETANRATEAARRLAVKYPEGPAGRVTVLPDPGGPFARALALDLGAGRAADDHLLFLVDVDMVWTAALLDRVRRNTARGRSVYFPIVYSEYDPVVVYGRAAASPNHFLIDQDTGYWRQYGFGVVAAYKSDLTAAGGFNTSIRGWGNEDVDLFEKFVRWRPRTVFRAADPDLVHVYHSVECDPRLPELKATMCNNTRFETYGNVDQFANIIYRNRRALYEFAAKYLNRSTRALPAG